MARKVLHGSISPWFGGYWERLIKLTKIAIKKTLGRAHINLTTLETIVIEVETILNDRPLTYISDDPADPKPLTPAHLLRGRGLTRLPHMMTTIEDIQDPSCRDATNSRKDAQALSVLLQHFVSRWRHDYLKSLREFYRPSNKRGGEQVKVGDVVLVHDDCARINWKMAVVESLITSKDNGVCSAYIRTRNGVTNRPVTKLYPLEVTDRSDVKLIHKENIIEGASDTVTTNCLRRDAAQRARQQIAEWVECIEPPGGCQGLLTSL